MLTSFIEPWPCFKLYTLSDNGQLVVWECDTDLDGLVPYDPTKKQKEEEEEDEEIDEEEKKKKGAKKTCLAIIKFYNHFFKIFCRRCEKSTFFKFWIP